MKQLGILIGAIFCLISSANAAQVSQVQISAEAPSQNTSLMDQRFEPIYEQQPYTATCSREVFDHTETSCSTVIDQVCHGSNGEVCQTVTDKVCNSHGCTNVPRRVCHQETRSCTSVPRRVCNDRAVYRTDYYACTQYRTVQVGQRLVKTFEHNIEVVVDRPELLQGQKLVVSLSANEASLSADLANSFNLNLLTVEMQNLANQDDGVSAHIATRVMIRVGASVASLSKILSSAVQNLQLSQAGISFALPGMAELSKDLNLEISLTKHRPIIKDKLLFGGTIDSSSLSLVASGSDLQVMIPLSKMQLEEGLESKRHNVRVGVSLKRPGLKILNSVDLSVVLNKRLEAAIEDVRP